MAKYRTNIMLTVEFDAEHDPREIIQTELDSILPAHYDFSILNITQVRRGMTILGQFSPEEVLPHLTTGPERREFVVGDKKFMVRMDSERYHVFAANRKCVVCGLEGVKFLLEQPPDAAQPHFNLYGIQGQQHILMTKDHIQAKAHGGENRPDNYQTMCAVCNGLKGSARLSLDGVRELRKIYEECRRGGSKKLMTTRINKAKQLLAMPPRPGERYSYSNRMRAFQLAREKASKPSLIVRRKILVQPSGHSFFAVAPEAVDPNLQILGEIDPGTEVSTTGGCKLRSVGIVYQGKELYAYHGWLEKVSSPSSQSGNSAYNVTDQVTVPEIEGLNHDPPGGRGDSSGIG